MALSEIQQIPKRTYQFMTWKGLIMYKNDLPWCFMIVYEQIAFQRSYS